MEGASQFVQAEVDGPGQRPRPAWIYAVLAGLVLLLIVVGYWAIRIHTVNRADAAPDEGENLLPALTGADHGVYLGAIYQMLTADSASAGANNAQTGALVAAVETDSPAVRAGLQSGDLIVAVRGQPLNSSHPLGPVLQELGTGQPVTLTVQRQTGGYFYTLILTATLAVHTPVASPRAGLELAQHLQALGAVDPGSQPPLQQTVADLGAQFETLTPGLALEQNLPYTAGAFVETIRPGGPAAMAGLMQGDVILRWNDQAVYGKDDLEARLSDAAPGDRMRLTLFRRGSGTGPALSVVLGSRSQAIPRAWLGVTFQPFDAQGDSTAGAFIAQVMPDSPADQAGLRTGDTITAVDGENLTDAYDLRPLIQAYQPGEAVELTVVRDGKPVQIHVVLGTWPEWLSMATPEPLPLLRP